MKGTIGGVTTTYIGSYFEWTGSTSTMKKYYSAGATRVAMRTGSSTINYLLGDHLGSQAITTNSSGAKSAEVRYYPWGSDRYTYSTTPTTYRFTGQRYESGLGLYFYNSRFYDPSLARFIQADTIVPGGVQGLDRYAYVGNNPLRYIDPSGHDYCDSIHANPEECDEINDDPVTGQQPKGGNPDFIDPNFISTSGPKNLPIENWSTFPREYRANSVLIGLVMYQGPHWWSGEIDQQEIIAWILFMEGSNLDIVDQKIMAQGIRALTHDNDFNTMLAAMTSFINPDRGDSFTKDDWGKLIDPGELMYRYLSIANNVWDEAYDPGWSSYKFWFSGEEMVSVNVDERMLTELGSFYKTNTVTGSSFYFTGVNTLAWCATSGSPAYCNP